MKRQLIASILAAVTTAAFLASGSAWGISTSWTNPGVGDWNFAGNWSNGVPPAGFHFAFIGNGGITQVSSSTPWPDFVDVGRSSVLGGPTDTGHLQVFGPGTTVSSDGLSLGCCGTQAGLGTLSINSGAMVTTMGTGTVGRTSFGASAATVTGSGSRWSIDILLDVAGSLDVNNLATVEAYSANIGANGRLTLASSATVTFTNPVVNSGLVQVGSGGTGAILQANLVNNGSLQFNHTSSYVHLSPISGTGTIQHMNVGSTTIASAADFTGDFTVSGGQLILQNTLKAKSYTVNNGMLRFENATIPESTPLASITANGTVEYLASTVTGRYLRGIGTHRVVAGLFSTFKGVTTFNSTNIVQDGRAFFDVFSNGGTLTSNNYSTFTSTTNTASGRIVANGILETSDFLNNGVLTINSGSTLDNYGTALVNGGGSRTTVNPGGAIHLNGTQLDLNGALLVNNGSITNGPVNVYYGSLAKGAGAYGVVNVFDGGKFSPGNSPGQVNVSSMNLNDAGRIVLEIRDFSGTPGVGFDRINVSGNLNFNAGTTPNSKFTIELVTLNAANQPGLAANFNPVLPFNLPVFSVGGTIGGFSASEVAFDLSGFQNNLAGGSFSLVPTAGVMSLSFQPATGLPGDYNQNGTVDAADYTKWRDNLGSLTSLPNDDTAGVGPDDYTRWKTHFGESGGSGAGATAGLPSSANAAVPEPNSLLLLLAGISLSVCVINPWRMRRF